MKDLIVSGVPLRDPVGGKYGIDYTASTFLADGSRAVATDSVYGFHGDRPQVRNWFGTSRETLTLNVMGDTNTEHNELLSGWQGLLTQKDFDVVSAPQRSPLAGGTGRTGRSFNVSPDLIKTARCRMVGNPAIERLNEKTARLTAILEKIYGFWSSLVEYTSVSAPIAGSPQVVDLSSVALGSTAPIIDGKIRVKGPFTSIGQIMITDNASGAGIGLKFTTSLPSTSYVIIDMLTMKASVVTSDVWVGGIDYTPRVIINGDGQFSIDPKEPLSFPASFVYGVTVASSGYTAGTSAIQFRLRRSYHS